MRPPTRLYKYESVTAQTLQNIKGQVLYFGSPLAFNDPFDCALTPNIKLPTDEEAKDVRDHYLSKTHLTLQQRRVFENTPNQELCEKILNAAQDVIHSSIDSFLKNSGVSCFSKKNDDILMLSHYGDRHRGVCLEFNTKLAPFEKIKPVTYSPFLPTLNASSILLEGGTETVLKL